MNTYTNTKAMKKTYILGGIIVILAIVYVFHNKRVSAPVYTEPYRTTLSGTVDCLQPKNPNLPHTDECRIALRTDNGDYYALDFSPMSQPNPRPVLKARLSATGLVTPVEYLNSDQWQKYDMKGIFSVTDSVKQDITK